MQKLISIFGAVVFFFASLAPNLWHLPKTPSGQALDLENRFELTWSDEFDGDALDQSKWIDPWWVYERKGGYWDKDMVRVQDGNLIISTEYKENGVSEEHSKPGYYTGVVETRGKFEQCYGYFEVRCILPAATGMWSAFWMMNEGVYNVDGFGDDGTEVDVFESMKYQDHWWKAGDAVVTGIHYDGYGPESKGDSIGYYYANNPYEEYNTYGVEWTPEEYIFYINGVETGRITAGGVCDNPEYLILSCEVAGENGVANADRHGTGRITKTPAENWPAEFIVDYVRVYQHK
ncbi:MAG: glycoside hydrolase family 16 protein [Clostridia bacterium]|nr:glycoside hydrolase family 16 protein [Clostridia bacterium]